MSRWERCSHVLQPPPLARFSGVRPAYALCPVVSPLALPILQAMLCHGVSVRILLLKVDILAARLSESGELFSYGKLLGLEGLVKEEYLIQRSLLLGPPMKEETQSHVSGSEVELLRILCAIWGASFIALL